MYLIVIHSLHQTKEDRDNAYGQFLNKSLNGSPLKVEKKDFFIREGDFEVDPSTSSSAAAAVPRRKNKKRGQQDDEPDTRTPTERLADQVTPLWR
jgi:hypothetical protein